MSAQSEFLSDCADVVEERLPSKIGGNLAAVHAYAVKAAVADFGFSQAGRFETGDEFRVEQAERQHDGTDEPGPVLHVFLQSLNSRNDKIP